MRIHHVGAALAIAGGIVLAAGVASAPARATPADPPGNNGTIKIDGQPWENHPNNEPHPGCLFQVDFYGYDEGEDQFAYVTFELQPPTGTEVLVDGDPVFVGGSDNSGGGSEEGWDASKTYDLTDAITATGEAPHPIQGFHVRLTVHEPAGSQGNDVKHKVFWVSGCEVPPGTGDITLEKVTTGADDAVDDIDFPFTVECNSPQSEGLSPSVGRDITANDGPVTVVEDAPEGTVCTITETNTHGASSTMHSINGSAAAGGTSVTGVSVGSAVVFTNNYPTPFIPPPVIITTSTTTSTSTTTTTAPAAVLPVSIEATTTTTAPEQVLGVELARTGGPNDFLVILGALLILQGGVFELAARRARQHS